MREIHATFRTDVRATKRAIDSKFTLLSLGCCSRFKVGFTRGQQGGAFKLHPYMFTMYREVQLDIRPEIEVFHMLLERCHTKKKKRSLNRNMKYLNFLS